jgi:hypothetical protein
MKVSEKYFIDNIHLAGNVQELSDKENLTYVEILMKSQSKVFDVVYIMLGIKRARLNRPMDHINVGSFTS